MNRGLETFQEREIESLKSTLAALEDENAELRAEVERLRERPEYHYDMERISDILDGKPDGPLIFGRAWT